MSRAAPADIFSQYPHFLKETIISGNKDGKRVTLGDVAKAAGVSIATVDRVLNGRAPVSGKRAQQVYDAARRLGYHGLPLMRGRAPMPRHRIRLGVALRRRHHPFYQAIEAELRQAAARHATADIDLSVYHHADNSPAESVALVREMGSRCDCVALMAPDGEPLREAILALRQRHVFTFAMLSDFAADFRHAYVGVDNRKAGRAAAWGIAHTARRPGRVALIAGTYSYHAQELRELGFRAYMRQHGAPFEIVDAAAEESPDAVRVATGDLLDRLGDLVGLYVAGGGFEGALDALVARGRERGVSLIVNEVTPVSRQGLLDGTIAMAIATPVRPLAQLLVEESMRAVTTMGQELSRPEPLPFEIVISENVT